MKIFLALPMYGLNPNALSLAAGMLRDKASPSGRFEITGKSSSSSALVFNYNQLYAAALNAMPAGVTHFAMLHSDIAPDDGWLDVLFDELESQQADMLSAVVPLKDDRGMTSTAIDDPQNVWAPRRLMLQEVYRLPETFSIDDCRAAGITEPAGGLLLNTGCWICDLRRPWVREIHAENRQLRCAFFNHDAVYAKPDGEYAAAFASEDWNFSREMTALGGRLMATRKVRLRHFGDHGYSNAAAWGEESDQEWEKTRKKTCAYTL